MNENFLHFMDRGRRRLAFKNLNAGNNCLLIITKTMYTIIGLSLNNDKMIGNVIEF